MPQTLYLARHATPDRTNTGFIYDKLPGPPLTEQGIQEASALGAYFLSCGVRSLHASPFERCRRTAEIAAGVAGIPWFMEEGLGELQPGETPESILERAGPVFERVSRASLEDGPVALVTHGGVVGVLLQHLGMDKDTLTRHKTFDFGNPVPPAGVWEAKRPEAEAAWMLRLAFQPEQAPASA
jgi:probable phosphoglycerate mutase